MIQRAHIPRIAILGCGTIGSEVSRQLLASGDSLGVKLIAILVRDATRDRGLPAHLFVTSFKDVLAVQPDIIIEAIGGLDPAGNFVQRALAAGIPVVSANKTLLAHRGPALRRLAQERGAALAHEAAVCAALPIFAALDHLRGDRILSLRAVVNGTCNFILSRLAAGEEFQAALAEAQAQGFAEPDPSADISGRDSAEKLCLLAAAAGFPAIAPDQFPCEGIESITPADLADARRSRHTLKLIAELDAAGAAPYLRVGPALIPEAHPLATLRDEQNGVLITAELAGEIFLRGRGAGPLATASAILGDAVRLLNLKKHPLPAARAGAAPREPSRRHHLRIRADRDSVSPDRVFGALRRHATSPDELTLSRASITATAELFPSAAAALAHDIAGPGGQCLVLPVLE